MIKTVSNIFPTHISKCVSASTCRIPLLATHKTTGSKDSWSCILVSKENKFLRRGDLGLPEGSSYVQSYHVIGLNKSDSLTNCLHDALENMICFEFAQQASSTNSKQMRFSSFFNFEDLWLSCKRQENKKQDYYFKI